jgi:catalase
MRVDGNYGSTPHYEPNINGTWQEQPEFAEPPLGLEGAADRYDFRADDDDCCTQPGLRVGPAGPAPAAFSIGGGHSLVRRWGWQLQRDRTVSGP